MWHKTDKFLENTYTFDSFGEAITFVTKVADIANAEDHHPKIIIDYRRVTIQSTTHSAGDTVTDRDYALSSLIDELYGPVKADEKTPAPKEVRLFTDGGSRGNPGPSALGYAILDMEDNIVKSEGVYLGITTNNQAEYQALKSGLEACKKIRVREVHVHMDSALVVNQMNGIYQVKNRDLWPIHQSIKDLLPNFSNVTFTHVPREFNKIADQIVNDCLDAN